MHTYDFNKVLDRSHAEKWAYDSTINGHSVIPMSVADMDLESPIEIRNAIAAVAARAEYGYPAYRSDFKSVLADWQKQYYDWAPELDEIIETPGLLMTMGSLLRNLMTPEEGVIIITPVYHAFARTIRQNHRQVVECDMLRDENNYYTLDFDKFETLCAEASNKVAIVCNPHNPVGRCWSSDELAKLVEIAQHHGVTIICDEIHGDFVFEGKTFEPILKAAEDTKDIIVFSSGGKLFNIGGIFSSYCFTCDPHLKELLGIAIRELQWQPTAFAHEAAYAGYKYGHDYRKQLVDHVRALQTYIVDRLNSMPYPVKANMPEATYLLWADFNDTGWDGDEIHRFLVEEAGLGFNRGDQFGKVGAGFARINCGVPMSRAEEAMDRLEKAFANRT